MKLTSNLVTAATLVAVGLLPAAVEAQGKKGQKIKIKPTVVFAKTWDAAVAEAKLLNLPLVVHSHGFN